MGEGEVAAAPALGAAAAAEAIREAAAAADRGAEEEAGATAGAGAGATVDRHRTRGRGAPIRRKAITTDDDARLPPLAPPVPRLVPVPALDLALGLGHRGLTLGRSRGRGRTRRHATMMRLLRLQPRRLALPTGNNRSWRLKEPRLRPPAKWLLPPCRGKGVAINLLRYLVAPSVCLITTAGLLKILSVVSSRLSFFIRRYQPSSSSSKRQQQSQRSRNHRHFIGKATII